MTTLKGRPLVGVGVILHHRGYVLIGKRLGPHGGDTWCLPGGHLEFGESLEECARRELREETGLDAGVCRQGPFTNDVFREEGRHYITLFVKADYVGGVPAVLEPHKCSEWRWAEWHRLPEPLFLSVRHLVDSGYQLHDDSHDLQLGRAIAEQIHIEPYNPDWPARFDSERQRLDALFRGRFRAVEHVGSTAVPGLPAKPIIDIMAGVLSMQEADVLLPLLCAHGYTTSPEFNATLKDSRWLMRHASGFRSHHLHLVLHDTATWREKLIFRDALRSDENLCRQYVHLKRQLAETSGSDREAYTRAKTEFVRSVLDGES